MIGITHLLMGELIASKIAASGRKTQIKSHVVKDGKLVKKEPRNVSAKIRQRKSKRTKPVRRTV